ncbi:MAG: DUF4340 domain-containing protein, partial [Bacteroidota bacterium]
MKNKHLLAIFLGLLFVSLTAQFLFEKKARRFELDLVQLDTAAITSLRITPKRDRQMPFSLEREGQFWAASKANITVPVNPAKINPLLVQLSQITSDSIVAKASKDWVEFEVTPELGTRIQIYAGKQILEDFYTGRFEIYSEGQKGNSYLRFKGAKEVYAVSGLLSVHASKGFTSYRNSSILHPEVSKIQQFIIQSFGEKKSFEKTETGWTCNGMPVDALGVANYLAPLKKLVGKNFVDDFDEVRQAELLHRTLLLKYS